jgi:hypothetical protein
VLDAVPLCVAAELDLMAALAGMRLRTLGATSKREQFESRSHVSVWQKPA